MSITLASPAFQDGEPIPQAYTGDGPDQSPPLQWSDPPTETKSLALICEDPDAPRGTFTHWVIFNLPADCRELKGGFPAIQTSPSGAIQGKNDFGKIGYSGPAPPRGKLHHYLFKLFALDCALDQRLGITRNHLLAEIKNHILDQGALTGTYARR